MTIKRIITLENTKNLKLKHITTNFEKALINAIISVFPDIKLIGCFIILYLPLKRILTDLTASKKKNLIQF